MAGVVISGMLSNFRLSTASLRTRFSRKAKKSSDPQSSLVTSFWILAGFRIVAALVRNDGNYSAATETVVGILLRVQNLVIPALCGDPDLFETLGNDKFLKS